MRPKLFADDDDDESPQNESIHQFQIDENYARRLEYNRKREDLQRLEEKKKKGLISDDDDEDSDDDASEPDDDDDDDLGNPKSDLKFVDLLLKVKKKDPSIKNKDVNFFESDESEEEDGVDKKDEKKKKMYLKDVQAKHLLEEGPEYDDETKERRIRTYDEKQKELRQAVIDALETGGNESDEDGEDLLKVAEKEGGEDREVVEELDKKMVEYYGEEEAKVYENQFLKDYLVKQLWKEKDEKIDEAELEELEEDEEALEMQEEYEINYRHEENAGEIVMGQSRIVEGSVRKKDNARKAQRKSKEERMKMAEIERKEELKRLKNVKKKEMKEKMKKVLSIAGFKDGEECPLNAKDFDDEFDPEEYDKMMKAAFDDKYYGEEDSDLNSDEDDDDGEKPDFDKEDELLGLPKDWDVIQGGDGFIAAREKVSKRKEIDDDAEEEDEEVEEKKEEEDKEVEEEGGKRKRKRKTSLVQRAKEAMMEEYYKLDYEDTIGDLKTRFKYAKVQPKTYELETEEILGLDDKELNQYVPLKKMATYVEKDWEVNKHKVKEQKLKIREILQGKHDEKRSKKKKKKKSDVAEMKPTEKTDVEGEAETKLSRKAKRRRRQAEKKAEKELHPSRMIAYGKA